MRTHGRVAWLGLVVLLFICLSCGGALTWMYSALAAFKHSKSVVRITSNDKNLQAASTTAKKFFPQFLKRLAHPQKGDRFAIKGRFVTPVGPEYLWLKDPVPTKDGLKAILDQPPIAYKAHKGDLLIVKSNDVYDWMIKRADGSMAGGFTENVLDPNR